MNDLLDRSSEDQPVDLNVTFLTDSKGSIHRLKIVGRIPRRVEDDNLVGSREVQTAGVPTKTKR